jgi:uncharacterized protein (TIGR02145 family)
MRNKLLLFSFSALLFWTCSKNDAPSEAPNPETPVGKVSTTLTGIVTNETGQFLQGVSVTVGSRTTTTDKDGLFLIENVEVPENRYYIKATLNNYFESGSGGIAVKDGVTTVLIKLMSMGTPKDVSATAVSTNVIGGATLKFDAGSFVNQNGAAITSGTVSVYARSLNPGNPNFTELVPGGDLNSTMPDGSPATLESYGMVGVELRDANNNEVKLASGKQVEIRFPIASSQLTTSPAEIPLLSMDPETGVWKQEGVATKMGSEYVGKVGHFSWWNCDVPQNMSTVKGRVVDCNGKPLSGVTVVVNGQYTRITDANGYYEGMVPRIRLTFEVKMIGKNVVISNPVTIQNPQPGLNTVQDIKVGDCPTYITGTLNRCNNTNLFYIRALWGQTMNEGWVPLEIKGDNFSLAVPHNRIMTIRLSSGAFTKDTVIGALTNGQVMNIGLLSGCVTIPSLITKAISNATPTSATSGGEIIKNGGGEIFTKGVVWSDSPNPSISLSTKTNNGSGNGNFISSIIGLANNTKYYIRAYAINSAGTAYGNEIIFTTGLDPNIFNPNLSYGSVTDQDNNTYKTIQIGTQVWMAENLRTTKYRNGIVIPNITDNTLWQNNTTGAWSYYENNSSNNTLYGKLYNWYAVTNVNKLCPTGWHVPNEAEWTTLIDYLDPNAFGGNSTNTAGGKMKSTGVQYWRSPNQDATNSSGFSGFPGAARFNTGLSLNFSIYGYWWASEESSANEAWLRALINSDGSAKRLKNNKNCGFSVRCLRD